MGDIILSICSDQHENIWIGTNNGLHIFTASGDTLSYSAEKLGVNPNIQSIIQDKKGQIWIGTSNSGILKITSTENVYHLNFEHYSVKNNKIDLNEINCIFSDSKQRIWVATKESGLYLYNQEKDCFERVKGIKEFSEQAILSILESDNYLYLGTYKGLLQYNPDGEEDYQLIVFTKSDGLAENMFNFNAAMKGNDGLLYFGSPHGFTVFDPKQIEIQRAKESLVITDVKIFHNSFDHLSEKLQRRISPKFQPGYGKKLILSHKEYNFGIEFATLSYKHPDKNRYAYKLDGFDTEWYYVNSDNRSAYYTNMKSGSYRFLVKGTNENSFMNPPVELLEILVLPPPHQTWWAYLIYSLLSLLFIIGCIRFILYKENIKLKKREHQQKEALTQEKLMFFTNITHELLTPLAIINCSIEELQKKYKGQEHGWKAIKGNIFRLNRLLEQILEFRKTEKGKLKLSVSYGDIGDFVMRICRNNFIYFEPEKQIEFIYRSEPEHIPAWFDKNATDMILYNLLSNAFKYNCTQGKVVVSVRAEGQLSDFEYEQAVISVWNTGNGFSPNQLSELFNRFQSFDYSGREKRGNGIGLYLTKNLVELHKGKIDVRSIPNEWTEFTVKIPIAQSFYVSGINKEEHIEDETKILPNTGKEKAKDLPPEKKEKASILLIEDDVELLVSLSNLLTSEFQISQAKNGTKGLAMAKEKNPELIISDVMLPRMNGFELCRRIKEDITTCHIPVILLTAKVANEDKLEGFKVGADAYITKPFHVDLLIAQINSLLSNRKKITNKFRQTPLFPDTLQMHTQPDQQFLEEAGEIVERNIDNPDFDVQIFLSEMRISNSMLYRKLKVLTGLSPNEFIRNIRLKTACKLLKTGEYNISEIAYKVGFNDAKYFSSCFKKEFNLTPSEYILNNVTSS